MSLLTADVRTHRIGDQTILHDVSLALEPGERVAVVGPSGSGKSTLLTLLAGVTRPTEGRILFPDAPINDTSRQDIAYIFQSYGLVALLTAAENIEITLRAGGRTPSEARRLSAETLQAVGMEPFADHLTEELSGGQQQRTAVALALAKHATLLLADEPTAEQDAGNRDLVLKHLLAETERGATLVVATHDPEVAARCDRTLHLTAGHLSDGDR